MVTPLLQTGNLLMPLSDSTRDPSKDGAHYITPVIDQAAYKVELQKELDNLMERHAAAPTLYRERRIKTLRDRLKAMP